MIQYLQRRYALSRKGAVDNIKGMLCCALQNISFMVPVGLLYLLVGDVMGGTLTAERIPFYAIGCIAAALFIVVCTRLEYDNTFLVTYVESGVRRVGLAEKLRKIPLSFFGKKDLADLTSSIMNDCAVLEQSQSHFVAPLYGAMLSTAVIAVSMLFFNWRMALAAIWPLPVAFAIVALASGVQKRLSRKATAAKVACEDGVQECIEAMPDLRANNAESAYLAGLEKKIRAVESRLIKSELGTSVFVVSAGLVLRLGIATTILVGSMLVLDGSCGFMTLFCFLLVASRIYAPFDQCLMLIAELFSAKTSAARMKAFYDEPLAEGAEIFEPCGHDVAFENVGFSYGEGGPKVLDGVTFTAKEGEVTALVGPSGSGKSTCARLAARLWDATEGRVTVGGVDVATVDPEVLLRDFSVVFQDVVLFDDTVAGNVRLGRRGATDDEVLAAACAANCEGFVSRMPEGYLTMVGENGARLSGGERQRISIARALLKDAPIVLLDEATASLDVENETEVQGALSHLLAGRTVIVIAHRMRTVMAADKVIVLDGGRVAEQGSPAELLARDGLFARMVRLQTESAEWAL